MGRSRYHQRTEIETAIDTATIDVEGGLRKAGAANEQELMVKDHSASLIIRLLMVSALVVVAGCERNTESFDAADPAMGPATLLDISGTVSDGQFPGGDEPDVEARDVVQPEDGTLPDCGADCVSFCRDQGFENPVHQGLCPSLWGVGLAPQPVDRDEACRRLHVDTKGRFPTREELVGFCDDRPWGEIVSELIDSDEFVLLNQRKWADRLLYNTRALSVERIYDMDKAVGMLYRGEIAYDHFAAIVSAHPVLTRRHDTSGDRAEALFQLFLGRPPLGHERSDFARLYALWHNGYYDHPQLDMRLSDSFIEYRCVDDEGNVDPESRGECTSILYGYNELILSPDIRADRESGRMWSGLLTLEEWEKLQLPGRLLAQQDTFWEHAVDDILEQYLDYNLAKEVPEVRQEVVEHILAHNGDIRAAHHAVLSSVAYLQSARGDTTTDHRWTYGPLKQVHAEMWIDTMDEVLDLEMPRCDRRISNPDDFLRDATISSINLVENSRWELNDDGTNIRNQYSQLARNLGGCQVNDVSGRFRIVSILTTSRQLNFVDDVCNPGMEADRGAALSKLLPAGIEADRAVTPELAEEIVIHQIEQFYGRPPSDDEIEEAREHGQSCELDVCRASEFARPACFAVLSSSEMLFY